MTDEDGILRPRKTLGTYENFGNSFIHAVFQGCYRDVYELSSVYRFLSPRRFSRILLQLLQALDGL